MSPIHVQYLKNMGVAATLVASLVVSGRLWGLVACHHYSPRAVQYEIRAACELLTETVATRIAALESFVESQAELSVRRLEQRMVEAVSREGDWRAALFDSLQSLLHPLDATGAALLFEGQVHTVGEVVIADPRGRILLTNESFERLLGGAHPHVQSVEDLPPFFSNPAEVRRSLRDILIERRPWRGEVSLEIRLGVKPLRVSRSSSGIAGPRARRSAPLHRLDGTQSRGSCSASFPGGYRGAASGDDNAA